MFQQETVVMTAAQAAPVQEDSGPPLTRDTVEAIRPVLVKKGSFRRSERGRHVINATARWIVQRLEKSGLAFESRFAGGCSLSCPEGQDDRVPPEVMVRLIDREIGGVN
jgi:hypothetical protein